MKPPPLLPPAPPHHTHFQPSQAFTLCVYAQHLRDDDWGYLVGDDGLALAVVDADRLEGANAQRLPAVRHAVAVDTLMQHRGVWRSAGSCTHTPRAAVNHHRHHSKSSNDDDDITANTGSKQHSSVNNKHKKHNRTNEMALHMINSNCVKA